MKTKILSLTLVAGALMVLPTVSRAAIIGSAHDFGTNTWSGKNVCQACHIPHDSLGGSVAPLWNHVLPDSAKYTTYQSPTFNGGVAAPKPDGPSLACLGCHDGTLAINQFVVTPYGGTGVGSITNSGAVTLSSPNDDVTGGTGNNLSHNHPISFVYDDTLATADGTLVKPSVYTIGQIPPYPATSTFTNNAALMVPPVPASWTGISLTGKTIKDAMLWQGSAGPEMECTSCHDPHKMMGSSASSGIMIKISGNDVNGRGSLICRNCHLK